jgi:hypothetical protein
VPWKTRRLDNPEARAQYAVNSHIAVSSQQSTDSQRGRKERDMSSVYMQASSPFVCSDASTLPQESLSLPLLGPEPDLGSRSHVHHLERCFPSSVLSSLPFAPSGAAGGQLGSAGPTLGAAFFPGPPPKAETRTMRLREKNRRNQKAFRDRCRVSAFCWY